MPGPKLYSRVATLCRAFVLEVTGRVRFPNAPVGSQATIDGEVWTVFRDVRVEGRRPPMGGFKMRYRLSGEDHKDNLRFSIFGTAALIGLPGFRSNVWMCNESGEFLEVSQWQSAAQAKRYARRQAAEFIATRAIKDSATVQVLEKFERTDDPGFEKGLVS